MFGGVAFMLNGNMCVGVSNKSKLMVRFDPARHEEIAVLPGVSSMTIGKSGMRGFLFVEPEAVDDRRSLEKWVKLSVAYVGTLPKKATTGAGKATKGAKPAARTKAPKPTASKAAGTRAGKR